MNFEPHVIANKITLTDHVCSDHLRMCCCCLSVSSYRPISLNINEIKCSNLTDVTCFTCLLCPNGRHLGPQLSNPTKTLFQIIIKYDLRVSQTTQTTTLHCCTTSKYSKNKSIRTYINVYTILVQTDYKSLYWKFVYLKHTVSKIESTNLPVISNISPFWILQLQRLYVTTRWH